MDATATEIVGFDVERDLPALGVWAPVAIVGLRLLAALLGVVPSSPGSARGRGHRRHLTRTSSADCPARSTDRLCYGRYLGRDFVERRGWMDASAKTKFGGWLLNEKTSQSVSWQRCSIAGSSRGSISTH